MSSQGCIGGRNVLCSVECLNTLGMFKWSTDLRDVAVGFIKAAIPEFSSLVKAEKLDSVLAII